MQPVSRQSGSANKNPIIRLLIRQTMIGAAKNEYSEIWLTGLTVIKVKTERETYTFKNYISKVYSCLNYREMVMPLSLYLNTE